MDLFSDMIQAVQDDLTVDSSTTLLNKTVIKRAINRSRRIIYGLHLWPELEDAKKTSTEKNQEYYDYPTNWQADSIWKLRVDGVDYGEPLVFKDYLFEKENDFPSGLTNMWASQWRRFFIYPIPTTDGDNNIEVWGKKVGDELVNDTDTTIFSYAMTDVNEAIVLEADKLLKMKGNDIQQTIIPRVGEMHDLEAKEIVASAWMKITQNQQKYEKTTSFFTIPDFFGRKKTNTKIGDF